MVTKTLKDSLRERLSAALGGHVLPFVLASLFMALMFVLFRMKGVELDYRLNDTAESIKKESIINKELKARRAKLLSTRALRKLAKRHNLSAPKKNQILLVP